MHARNAAALVLVLGAAASPLRAADSMDTLPLALASHTTSDLAARGTIAVPAAPRRASFDAAVLDADGLDAADDGAPQSYLPVLYSALVPGLGEISMGYTKRGIALIAVEAAAWTGYFIRHEEGLDKRAEYEAFADANWNMQKWIDDHPCSTLPPSGRTLDDVEACGQASSGSGAWPGYIPWVSKQEDKQHYYENIGKYDWYISGWSDWDPVSDPYDQDTPLRDRYRAMRQASNDALDDATAFVWVSVAARAFSLVQTAILVHNRREGGSDDGGMALRARPRGLDGGEVALEVRFK